MRITTRIKKYFGKLRRNILLKDILIFWLRFIWKSLILRRPPNMNKNKSLEGTPYSSDREYQTPVAGERYVCESEWNAGISQVITSWGMTVKKRSKKIEKKALCPSVMVCLIEEPMRNWDFDFSHPFVASIREITLVLQGQMSSMTPMIQNWRVILHQEL